MSNHSVTIDTASCIGCGLCAGTCAAHNIEVKNGKAKTILEDCVLCGQCTAVCPREAVTISGYDAKPIAIRSLLQHYTSHRTVSGKCSPLLSPGQIQHRL